MVKQHWMDEGEMLKVFSLDEIVPLTVMVPRTDAFLVIIQSIENP